MCSDADVGWNESTIVEMSHVTHAFIIIRWFNDEHSLHVCNCNCRNVFVMEVNFQSGGNGNGSLTNQVIEL